MFYPINPNIQKTTSFELLFKNLDDLKEAASYGICL
jgi:hypothetical protein